MVRIQNLSFKKTVVTLAACILFLNGIEAQTMPDQLEHADSLFNQQKYTQSYQIYKRILTEDGQASPAMFLKMAFIREGLGDYSDALYYLNLYYLQTNNKRALKKMEDLAKKYDLQGYKYTDFEFFVNIFNRYYLTIVLALGSLLLLLITYIIYKRQRLHERPGYSLFYFILTVLMLFYVVNFGRSYQKGIIIGKDSYLMNGPSAGAKLLAVIHQGHRVKMLGKEDVWVKIRWNDQVAYIRDNNILPIVNP